MRTSRRLVVLLGILCGFSPLMPASAQDHQYGAEQIQAGYRLYSGQCQLCHGVTGDGIAGINLARQQFHTVRTDDDIRRMITTGNPQGMPPFSLRPEEQDNLVAFIRSGMDQSAVPFNLGDAARGKIVFDAKGGCAGCHRVAGVGARIGPDLTDIGFLRRPGQIVTALTDPDKATIPINRPVTIVTRDGRTLHGRRYDEDTFSVRLIDAKENLVSILKSDIRSYDISRTADMPSFRDKLSSGDMADLLAYLVTLRG